MQPDGASSPHLVLSDGAPPEAQSLLERWNVQWPGVQPWRHLPREARPDAWVRFHTLVGGRQTPRHQRDRRTAVRRFRSVVRTVEEISATPATVLLVEAPRWAGEFRDRVASVVPTAQPWVTHVFDDDPGEDDDHNDDDVWPDERHSFRSGPVDAHMLGAIALLVHDRDADLLLLPADLSWAVSAYEGGIDAVVRNPEEAAVLAARLRRWLPPEGWSGAVSWTRPATQRELHRAADR